MFSGAAPGDRVGGTEWSIVRILARGRELGAWLDLNIFFSFLDRKIFFPMAYNI